jgi:sialate O-acetylesterase
MQFPMAAKQGFGGISGAEQEIREAVFPRIRLFLIQHTAARQPKTDVVSSGWTAVTPRTVGDFSAVAYLFGRELHQRYRVPIGLIDASWGGTPAEAWSSAESLENFAEFQAALAREARLAAADDRAYDAYLVKRNAWYAEHGKEDRGRIDGHDLWASADYADSHWPRTIEPQPWPRKAVKDFDGTMWFRKVIDIEDSLAGKPLHLHLGKMLQADTTYFNGYKVGETQGDQTDRDYAVPASDVKPGRNLIAVRLAGAYDSGDGFVGMHGDSADLYVEVSGATLSLAGFWSYQPGPDLAALPEPPPAAEFHAPFPQAPALLFNGMIAPLTFYGLKGVIWYQGESNVGRAEQYRTLFPALIRDWRRAWHADFPFLFDSLSPSWVPDSGSAEMGMNCAVLRSPARTADSSGRGPA